MNVALALAAGAALLPTASLAFGPASFAELRAVCAECVEATPTPSLARALDQAQAALRRHDVAAPPARFCYAFVKPDAEPPHRQLFCRLVAPCGMMEMSHMAGRAEVELFRYEAARAPACAAEGAAIRDAFLEAFLTCRSQEATRAAAAHARARLFDMNAKPVADPDYADWLLQSWNEADIAAPCGAMTGVRTLLRGAEGDYETMTLGRLPAR